MNSQQLTVISVLMGAVLFSGCEGLRYAATEAQKENAWLHKEVCAAAADTANDENASAELIGLTDLASEQSMAFVMDYGLPLRQAQGGPQTMYHGQAQLDRAALKTVLSQATADSARKPDVFELADGVLELGIAVAGLIGGVYGIRIAGYLRQAREKSKALKEVVAGNELFKQLWPEHADRFKDAQQKQSPETKQLVTQLKAG
ncbi:MAG: hypothetical protein ACYSOH_02735 [Planctomycetota bacterium]